MTKRLTAPLTLLQISSRTASSVGLAVLLALSGCATTSESTDDASAGSASTGSEFSQGETPVEDNTSSSSAASSDLATAYFDYDRAEIRGDQRELLRGNAEILNRTGGSAIIEGHADERGSEEYNLALGERRAESVRKYLTALGVPRANLRVVSYGEVKTAVAGHDESAWRMNRRAEFRAQ